MDRRGGEQRRQEVVGHDAGVEGLGDGRDLLHVGQTAGQADVRADVLRAATDEQLAELPDGVHTLAVADGAGDAPGDLALALDAVYLDGIFNEERIEARQCGADGHSLQGRELAVNSRG